MSNSFIHHPSSYRDPSGFIFTKDDVLYRQVNLSFKENFDFFIESGCYANLIANEWLIPHIEIKENLTGTADWYKTLKPEKIDFISYPYEWGFDMLKDAALLTLQLTKEAIRYGLILKDATPYNIQWHKGKLIFIDTLSFEKYDEQTPWIAYRQFCEAFLSPLLLMHYRKLPLQQFQLAYPDGIPLAITSSLLPGRSGFSLHTYLHIHLNAKLAGNKSSTRPVVFSKQKLLNLLTSLELLIKKLRSPAQNTQWSAYYQEASLRNDYLKNKKEIVINWVNQLPEIKTAVDLGANDGEFSKLLAAKNIQVLTCDADAACINNLYLQIKQSNLKNIQPLIIDLANPSPANGVNNEERSSFTQRTGADLVMALALIHHLSIGKNISFSSIAQLFNQMGNYLIAEYVPEEDEKTQLLLQNKKGIYSNYSEDLFAAAFKEYFTIIDKKQIAGTGRVLYLMKKHEK